MLRSPKSFWISVVIKVSIFILNFSKDLKEYVGFEIVDRNENIIQNNVLQDENLTFLIVFVIIV